MHNGKTKTWLCVKIHTYRMAAKKDLTGSRNSSCLHIDV
uniref:Uncharacterized protein n=1 Tax=Rhizophora mucronata TaxID=61149 RepID=A0A2P2N6V2_RHIMU